MKILYAEDEKQLSMAVTEVLRMEGYEVEPVYDGDSAIKEALTGRYDAAVLDIMMPGPDGISVIEEMRRAEIYTPVLLLTAKAEVEDRIYGIRAGADDYLPKPFAMGELLARIEAMTRRSSSYVLKSLSCGNVSLDCDNNEVSTPMGSLILSPRETALLAFFMQNVRSDIRETDISTVLKAGDEDEMAVVLYVNYLKNKLRQIHGDLTIFRKNGFYRAETG